MIWLPDDPWVPCTAPKSNGSLNRDPKLYLQVVSQFNVISEPRYLPNSLGQTKCNIFVSDVTRALGCELPHWWLGKELNANAMVSWLESDGSRHGWQLVSPQEAWQNASKFGLPTVATWRNPVPTRPGHVAMVVPPPLSALGTSSEAGLWIAQAGAKNASQAPIAAGFGNLPVRLWSHP